ncbi:DUF58 domain-containing protein [Alicyclobacillus sp. ALC3]|uniref:DUF58 domain-containing protein n=1 Tax=Alicyclobacillus sp. ALC3 TaxID=2796143 RepID=UPI002379BE63|nr:DUF58 domain-containing protein [Alicyclobacillus sp. ALC3]WDL98303.1 DUF58 domain-containing protein [Alicyclobacillus sp. ALC3]
MIALAVPALLVGLLVWSQMVKRFVAPKLTVEAALTRASVEFEGQTEAVVTLTNPTSLPCPWVICEMEMPDGLFSTGATDGDASYTLALGPHEVVKLRLPITGVSRGRHHLQSLSVRASDGFTMFRYTVKVSLFLTVTVHPRRTSERTADVRLDRLGTIASTRKLAPTSLDWVDLRPYARGDSIRDVAWMVTARRGELTVLERALSLNHEVVLVASVHVSDVPWEGRVSLADAVYEQTYALMEQLSRRGVQFQLYTDAFWANERRKSSADSVFKAAGVWTPRAQQQMGHVLGSLSSSPAYPLTTVLDRVVRQVASPARVIVVTGYLDAGARSQLQKMRGLGYAVETLWVDPQSTDSVTQEVSPS